MRVRRVMTVVALAAVAASGLSACQSKVGAAAFVGKTRITESDVASYVLVTGAPSATPTPGDTSSTAAANPKGTALSWLLQEAVYTDVLAATPPGPGTKKSVPTDAELAAVHDEALQIQFHASVAGEQADQQLAAGLADSGLEPKFLTLFIRTFELEQIAIDRLDAKSPADLGAAFAKLRIDVKANPRYGSWDPSTLKLAQATPPSFLERVTPVPDSN